MILSGISQLATVKITEKTITIVGAGAVGLYAAHVLVRRNAQVIVIESGGHELAGFAKDSYASSGRRHEGIDLGRNRSLGGTSNLWGGQLVEFQPIDFNGRPWMSNSRWPVTYNEIQPYYEPTYEELGIPAQFLRDEEVWRSISRAKPVFDRDLEIFLTRWMKIPSLAALYANEIERHPNLIVLLNHTVIGLEGSGDIVRGVKVVDPAGAVRVIGGGQFILAAGTIETSRLLLHSAASAGWDCPWRKNQNVGAWFQDHLGGRVARVHAKSSRRFFDTFCSITKQLYKFAPKIRLANHVLERERLLNIQAMFDFESSVSENLVYLKQFVKAAIFSRKIKNIGDVAKNFAACSRYMLPLMWRYIHDHRIFVPSTSKISMLVQAEQMPMADSRITIDPKHMDSFGLPRAILHWKISEAEELASIREFVFRTDEAMKKAGLAHLEIDQGLAAGDLRFISGLHDTTHQSGGAIMGWSEADGVVDRNLKVFGTSNLYVGGAATFRSVGNANVTFTALTFISRLASHLYEAGRLG